MPQNVSTKLRSRTYCVLWLLPTNSGFGSHTSRRFSPMIRGHRNYIWFESWSNLYKLEKPRPSIMPLSKSRAQSWFFFFFVRPGAIQSPSIPPSDMYNSVDGTKSTYINLELKKTPIYTRLLENFRSSKSAYRTPCENNATTLFFWYPSPSVWLNGLRYWRWRSTGSPAS